MKRIKSGTLLPGFPVPKHSGQSGLSPKHSVQAPIAFAKSSF
ncbi:hypothetical protein ACQ9BO_15725 [Flavobacterium sp. P21]